jgi:hypothetical protein
MLDDDNATLKLKVYRSLGITVDGKGEGVGEGEYNRMVIRNLEGKADVRIVPVEQGKHSRVFVAKQLWDQM